MRRASDPILSAVNSIKLFGETHDDDTIERSFDHLFDIGQVVPIPESVTRAYGAFDDGEADPDHSDIFIKGSCTGACQAGADGEEECKLHGDSEKGDWCRGRYEGRAFMNKSQRLYWSLLVRTTWTTFGQLSNASSSLDRFNVGR
jgi:hypothetical protein